MFKEIPLMTNCGITLINGKNATWGQQSTYMPPPPGPPAFTCVTSFMDTPSAWHIGPESLTVWNSIQDVTVFISTKKSLHVFWKLYNPSCQKFATMLFWVDNYSHLDNVRSLVVSPLSPFDLRDTSLPLQCFLASKWLYHLKSVSCT